LNGQIGQEGCVGSATDEKDCNMRKLQGSQIALAVIHE